MHIYTVYNLHCCVLKRMPCECMFPKQMKRAKANQKHVISWMLWRHNGFSVLSQSSCSPCLQGFLFFLVSLSYMLPLLGTGSQDGSIGMVAPPGNQLYTGSEAVTSVLKLWMVLIFHDELPQPNEKERDEGGERKQETERENPGGILCLHSLGAFSVLVEYCTFLWQAYLHSPTHASLSNRMKSQRRSSFIQSERACSCACTPPLN